MFASIGTFIAFVLGICIKRYVDIATKEVKLADIHDPIRNFFGIFVRVAKKIVEFFLLYGLSLVWNSLMLLYYLIYDGPVTKSLVFNVVVAFLGLFFTGLLFIYATMDRKIEKLKNDLYKVNDGLYKPDEGYTKEFFYVVKNMLLQKELEREYENITSSIKSNFQDPNLAQQKIDIVKKAMADAENGNNLELGIAPSILNAFMLGLLGRAK